MNDFYKELQGRMEYLESLEDSEEKNIRINELALTMFRVQQILLENLNKK